jgi:hypothetical protein
LPPFSRKRKRHREKTEIKIERKQRGRMLAPKPPFNRKQKLYSLRKIQRNKPLGVPGLDRQNSLPFSVWRRRLRQGIQLLIHRPHQIYELVLTFLRRCTRTDYQLSIREEYTRALLLTQHHANKKVPLNTEASSHRSCPWRRKHASRSRGSSLGHTHSPSSPLRPRAFLIENGTPLSPWQLSSSPPPPDTSA